MSFSFKLASLKLTQRSTSLSKFSPLNIKKQSYSSFNYSNTLSLYGKNYNSLFIQQKKHTFFTPLLCNQKLTNNSVLLFQAANYGTHLQKKARKEKLQQKKYARRKREKLKKRKLAERQALQEGKEVVEEVKEGKEEEPVVSKQDKVRNYLKKFDHINEYTFATLINGAVSIKKAETLFSVIDEYNVKPSVLLYNLLLKMSYLAKDKKRAKKYYNIIKENFIPDAYTYGTMFKLCADTKNIEYSDELYKDMVAFGVPPQLECYSNLIASCRGQTDSQRTDKYYDELIDNNIELSPALFVSVMKSLRYTSDPKKTDFYLEEYLNHSFPITEQFFAPLIVTCQQSSNIEKAEEYLGKMKKLGLLPGLSTITAVIACCVNSGNISKAEEYLALIEKSKLEPNVITYYNLIATCYNAKDYIRGDKYYRTMVLEKNMAPGPYITALHKKVHDEIQIRAGAKLIFGEE